MAADSLVFFLVLFFSLTVVIRIDFRKPKGIGSANPSVGKYVNSARSIEAEDCGCIHVWRMRSIKQCV